MLLVNYSKFQGNLEDSIKTLSFFLKLPILYQNFPPQIKFLRMRLNLNFLQNLDKTIQKQWKQHPNNELRRIDKNTSYSFCCYSCFNSKSIFGTIFNLVIFIKRIFQQIFCKMGSKMFHDLIFWRKHSGILPNKCCKNWHTEMEISSDMKFQKVFLFLVHPVVYIIILLVMF